MSHQLLTREDNVPELLKKIYANPEFHKFLTEQTIGHFQSLYYKLSPLPDIEVRVALRDIALSYKNRVIPYYSKMQFFYDSQQLGLLLQKPSKPLLEFWDEFARAIKEPAYTGERRDFLSLSIAMPIELCRQWRDVASPKSVMSNAIDVYLGPVCENLFRRIR